MREIELNDIQVGQKYFIEQVKDEYTHAPISRKFIAFCTAILSSQSGWLEYEFNVIKKLNSPYIPNELSISLDEWGWGMYRYHSYEKF